MYSGKYGTFVLSVNNGEFIPTIAPNPNQLNNPKLANAILVHEGYSTTWRGSAGCFTIAPVAYDAFINVIPSNSSGWLIVNP